MSQPDSQKEIEPTAYAVLKAGSLIDAAESAEDVEDVAEEMDATVVPLYRKEDFAELYEALKLLLEEVELSGNAESGDFGWPAAVDKSRAALAKSRGAQS